MRTTNDRNTGFNLEFYRKILGFPFVGVLLMALCMSFVSCGDDDTEIVVQGDPWCGVYVGTCKVNVWSSAEGGAACSTINMPNASLIVSKNSSNLTILYPTVRNENGKWDIVSKLKGCNYEDLEVKKESVSGDFKSDDGNSTWKVFCDGTNVRFESYDKTQDGMVTEEVTIVFEGKKQE